jgi:uncharacterized protein
VAKLSSAKFDRYISQRERDQLMLRLWPLIELVEVVEGIRKSRDPNDDKFLEAAVNGHADVLVTGDQDLLQLHPFRGVAILKSADYLQRIP